MPKHHHMKIETGSYTLSGNDPTLTRSIVVRVTKRNWLLLSFYGLITIAGIIASYFTNQWISVAVSFAFAVITFLIGLYMLIQVVTITSEIR
jgi:uncharacterized membrane protein YfcA